MIAELWKTVNGFPNYEVSDHGRVRNVNSGLILASTPTGTNGNLQVKLARDGKKSGRTLHHLVAEHFIDGYQNGYCVRHYDGNRDNNKKTNLYVDHDSETTRIGDGRGKTRNNGLRSDVLSRFDI